MVTEAPLERAGAGLVPKGEGWFVLNVRDARWLDGGKFGMYTRFEGDPRFPQLGINIGRDSLSSPAKRCCPSRVSSVR